MSYIPKSAQRKIDAYKRMQKETPREQFPAVEPPVDYVPRRLRAGEPGAGMWDVYLDGVQQHLCQIAEAGDPGAVIRYKHGKGNIAQTRETELVRGRVVILRKGTPLPGAPAVPAPTLAPEPIAAPSARRRVVIGGGSARVLALAAMVVIASGEMNGKD